MAVTLTSNAASHVQRSLSRRGKGLGLRVGVRTSGCSGLASVAPTVSGSIATTSGGWPTPAPAWPTIRSAISAWAPGWPRPA